MDGEQIPENIVEDCRDLLQNVEDIQSGSTVTGKSFASFRDTLALVISANQGNTDTIDRELLLQSLRYLTLHAHEALVTESDYFTSLFQVLSMATRASTTWRTLFGSRSLPMFTPKDDGVSDPEPDCILEVARRVITLKDAAQSPAVESALKIIANCCADNDFNRNLIIDRDGINTLVMLSQNRANLDALIPTLYNVCVGYEEPVTIPAPAHSTTNSSVPTEPDSNDEAELSVAARRLAMAHHSLQGIATFELLLHFQQQISDPIKPYLAELVAMATQPALLGFENVWTAQEQGRKRWSWSFSLTGSNFDTIALTSQLGREDPECLTHMCRAILSLLSKEEARAAILQRNDDAMWVLLTLACHTAEFTVDDDSFDEDLVMAQTEFLKLLYVITGDPSFIESEPRSYLLLERCIDQLEFCVRTGEQSIKLQLPPYSDKSRFAIMASACVILSQLAASASIRNKLLAQGRLTTALVLLLSSENNPDVLYPAITIVSRMALTSQSQLAFVQAGALHQMQRFLTAKGLGLVVPFETVTAYKTIIRGRPSIFDLLVAEGQDGRSILQDTITLYAITMEPGTKLEIGKFFLEILRTVLPEAQKLEEENDSDNPVLSMPDFKYFLSESSVQLAEIFTWVCTKAEPQPQQDHGWFGLAMLSLWEETHSGIFKVINESRELRDAISNASRLSDGAIRGNLMLMLSKLHTTEGDGILEEDALQALVCAKQNLGLNA